MEQTEAVGVLIVGIGCIAGSVATTQEISVAVVPAVLLIVVGIAVTVHGKSSDN